MTGFASKCDGIGYVGTRGLKGNVWYFNTWRLLF